ncbi:SIMPL domain-containing protein [Pelagibacterium montanilacus]|uniref:SIMPL domain-containing protein n=1 Tax=Pelagibacterium montanilacus TaxID=2185280 RepID=UPI0013DFA358|nr:SIMPL domain-containing protein [Pelagibacterium montanilacus]
MRTLALLVPLGLAALATPALADDRTMALSGTGIVRAAPDMASITTGVTTQAETAREALDANTEAMSELTALLREAGLEDRDIQTTEFSVSPQYVYSDQRDESGYTPPPRITGYEVTNAVTIIVRELDDLGVILDRAVSSGANAIRGIAFEVEDTAALLDQARRRAVAEAQAKAETYAEAAGIALGDIVAISESPESQPPQPMMAMARAEVASDMAVPVEAGEMSYSITATITWEIEV